MIVDQRLIFFGGTPVFWDFGADLICSSGTIGDKPLGYGLKILK